MAIIGPRPLLVRYLDRYNEEQRHRHDVRPGLTGYAQAHGRNAVSWEDKFAMDVWYTTHITLVEDGLVGIYSFIVTFVHILNSIYTALNNTWVPIYYSYTKDGNYEMIKEYGID